MCKQVMLCHKNELVDQYVVMVLFPIKQLDKFGSWENFSLNLKDWKLQQSLISVRVTENLEDSACLCI